MRRSVLVGLLLLLCVYTFAALIVNVHNALPLLLFEIFIAFWVSSKFLLRKHASAVRTLSASAHELLLSTSGRRCLLGGGAALLHLIILLALGTRTVEQWCAVAGLGAIVLGCYFASLDRQAVRWRPVVCGFILQFWIAVVCLRTPVGLSGVRWAGCQVSALLAHAHHGAAFVFGSATDSVWAFAVLPVTIFFSSLCAVFLLIWVVLVVL